MGQTTISAIDQLPASLNANFLREEARRRVEQLAGSRWTDYNTHDPGITILEVLAYAVTDLGLRVRLEIPDLIAEGVDKPFFTAREVLPSAAFTPADYRRRLLDLPEVRNAWITSQSGVHTLLLDLKKAENSVVDLNETWLRGRPWLKGEQHYEYYVVFPHWDAAEANEWSGTQALSSISIESILAADSGQTLVDGFSIKAKLTFAAGTNLERRFWIRLPLGIAQSDLDAFVSEATNSLSDLAFWEQHRLRGLERKKLLANTIVPFVRKQRNLCEDWGEITTIKLQQIGVKAAAIELQPEANPEAVLANICFALDQLIDPAIPRSTFQECINKGKTPGEIWEGPLPEHGYVSETIVHQNARLDLIYTSDMVRVIMEQPEVIGVSGVVVDHFMDRVKVASNVQNCLRLRNTSEYKPKFSFFDTQLPVFKRGVQIAIDQSSLQQNYAALVQKDSALPNTTGDDLIPPSGETGLDIRTFYSIQNEFPAIYGLREGEILTSAPPSRHAQVKQFKTYLLFFEQILSNNAAQLARLQDLFSTRENIDHTYFFQALYNVPEISALLKDFPPGNTAWSDFVQSHNDHVKKLAGFIEDDDTFLGRRNQFLNHLLARVGESFADYEAWSLAQNDGKPTPDLVYDKLSFLHHFPQMSGNRALAFDYAGTAWDTDNVSGYEKRVAALLGMPDRRRRSLSQLFDIMAHVEIYSQSGSPGAEEAHFRIYSSPLGASASPKNQVLISSKEKRQVNKIEQFVRGQLAEAGKKANNYRIKPAATSSSVTFEISDHTGTVLTTRHNYIAGRGLAFAAIRDALHLFQGRQMEGMHLVEHAILRPIADSLKELDPVMIPGSGETPFVLDPYPYQVSIFLPSWAPRFQEEQFQVVVERVLRNELPVHILPYIYWVKLDADKRVPTAFIKFEDAWRAWLEQRDAGRLDTLVDAINLLRKSDFVRLTPAYRAFNEQVTL